MRTKRNAFTLIELLVVVSIIALLISILMPALSKAREQAKRTVCLTNCHSWGVATFSYTRDNSDFFPTRFSDQDPPVLQYGWPHQYFKCRVEGWKYYDLVTIFLEPYLVDVEMFWCPSVKHTQKAESWETLIQLARDQAAAGTYGWIAGDYGYFLGYGRDFGLYTGGNVNWGSWAWEVPPTYERDKDPYIPSLKNSNAKSYMSVMGDIVTYRPQPNELWYYNHPYKTGTQDEPHGMVASFVDTHAEFIPLDNLRVLMQYSNGNSWMWPNPKYR
jgi:prepilin-type N-terminal cleavage/methylation domain-containing protein